MYVCMYVYMNVCMNEGMFVYICTCVYVGIMCLCARPHTKVQPCVCIALTHKTVHAINIFTIVGKIFDKPRPPELNNDIL
jgi:hypothetical protein